MHALQVVSRGKPPELKDIPPPTPKEGEVAVKISACGLNFADLLMIDGKYQEKPALPFTLGMELSGTITRSCEAGPPVGTRVAVMAGHGGLAERGAFAAASCTPLPDAMSFEHAAAFQIAYGTSHVALVHRAHVGAGDTVLVLGAAGGVGLTAVEIAHQLGARVIACARGPAKLEIAKQAGADVVLDSDRDDLRDAIRAEGGADVVYDTIGEPLFSTALRACNPGARYLIIGFAAGQVPQIAANYLLVKNITVHGLYWGGYRSFAPQVLAQSMAELFDWYGSGLIRPHISHTLPLARAEEGLELLKQRKTTGKVVITI